MEANASNTIIVNWYVIALVINFIVTVAGVAFVWGRSTATIKNLEEKVRDQRSFCDSCRHECRTDLTRRLEKIEGFMQTISKFMGSVSRFMQNGSSDRRGKG